MKLSPMTNLPGPIADLATAGVFWGNAAFEFSGNGCTIEVAGTIRKFTTSNSFIVYGPG